MIDLRKGLFLLLGALSACTSMQNNTAAMQNNTPGCQTKEACLNDPKCLCWCAVKCGYRQKTAQDKPVYKNNDKYGKFCYCKEWDYNEHENRCMRNKNMNQPDGAM